MIGKSSRIGLFGKGIHLRRLQLRLALMVTLLLCLCSVPGSMSSNGIAERNSPPQVSGNSILTDAGNPSYEATGAAQAVTMNGVFSNESQQLVLIDSSAPTPVSINAPLGWTGDALSGTIEHLSTQIGQVENGLLDDYHTERYIILGSPWNSETYYMPDGWSLVKKGDSTPHPGHGGLYWYASSGSGREGSMGWRPSVLFDTTKTLDPSMEIYLSQQVQLPWREVYSCRISFQHRVPTQTLNGIFYLFVRVGNYEAKFNVFNTGYTTNAWLQATVDIPASAFASISVPGSVSLAIGLSTDFSGLSPSNINNFVYIDEIEATFKARPFPEQIGLSANQSIIKGSTPASISPYVPDGAYRDCYDHPTTGIATSPMDVGVKGTTWSDTSKYQTAFQFQLDIPRGAVITSAQLEIEALSSVGGGNNGLRVYVAQHDSVTSFSSGLPHLEDRYNWSTTSADWLLDSWISSSRYKSPDLSSLVQSVISREGWSSGNYICIMLDYMFSDIDIDYH